VSQPLVINDLMERKNTLKRLYDRKRKTYKEQWIDASIEETGYLSTKDFLAACEFVGYMDILPDDLGKAIKRKYYENLPERKEVGTPFTCGTCVDGVIQIFFEDQPIYRPHIFCTCGTGRNARDRYLSNSRETDSWVQKKINDRKEMLVTESHLLFVKGLIEEKERQK